MMLDRDKITFWTRIGAIALAVIFVGTFIFLGVGSNVTLLDVLGNSEGQEKAEQTTGSGEQITKAEQDLAADPENPRSIRLLAGLYIQDGRTDRAEEVLQNGRRAAPEDPIIPLQLGQIYERDAQVLTNEEERQARYAEAGDAYAAAADLQDDRPQPYLAAGVAYEQAGQQSKAIEYWNGYLELEPEGEQADAIKERISTLLQGGETTTGPEGKAKANSPGS